MRAAALLLFATLQVTTQRCAGFAITGPHYAPTHFLERLQATALRLQCLVHSLAIVDPTSAALCFKVC